MTSIDPLALLYAAIQLYKLYQDDKRFDAELAAIKAKGLDAAGILVELHRLRDQARAEAHAAIGAMPDDSA